MPRILALVIFASTIAWPAAAQVINGETPLDETPLAREALAPAEPARAPAALPPSAADQDPARRDVPQTAPRRD